MDTGFWNAAVASTDIFGMIILVIVLSRFNIEEKQKSRRGKAFMALVIATIVALFVDFLSYLSAIWGGKVPVLHYTLNLIGFIIPFFVYALFLQYLYLHINTKSKTNKSLFIIGVAYCGVGIIFTLIYGLIGRLFTIDDTGTYQVGEYYEGYILTFVVVLAYTIFLALFNSKKMGIKDAIATLMFIVIPVVFVILNVFFPYMAFSISALSISVFLIYTTIQQQKVNELIENEKQSVKLAHVDELTGLPNRLAFSKMCEKLSKTTGTVGIVFADVNGLKYTNDHYGHKAGDKLICDFADILSYYFRKEEVYRISGDEFVIISKDILMTLFKDRIDALHNKINEMDIPIASIGSIFGSSAEVNKLIDIAEGKMYIEKKDFHDKYPLYNRIF